MARPSKTAAIDYAQVHDLTHGLLDRATCPAERPFVLVKDAEKKGLRLRVTKAGGKHWQFETRLRSGKLFTRALGEWPTISIADARIEAHKLRGQTEQGTDPREAERRDAEAEQTARDSLAAEAEAKDAREVMESITVGDAWTAYLDERRPYWGDLHFRDHLDKSKAGGEPSKRRGAKAGDKTKPGPLAALMPVRLIDLDAPAIERWAATEGKARASSARLAWRLLTVFLTWCSEQPQYSPIIPAKNPAKTRKAREALGKPGVKSDVLTRDQLPSWFAQVHQIQNPGIAAALQVMLLTGARPGEVMSLRWEDVNTQWKGLNMRDKVEGTREIPLTPYVASLLAALPRRNEWVFSSAYALEMSAHNIKRRATKAATKGTDTPVGDVKNRSAEGRLTEPNTPHTRACKAAGLEGLTLHGLRRSFASLTEWLEIPAGVVAQIQGHKPSATAEKHYKRRPLDLLRMHHERIESWVLQQAGVKFDATASTAAVGGLRVVNS